MRRRRKRLCWLPSGKGEQNGVRDYYRNGRGLSPWSHFPPLDPKECPLPEWMEFLRRHVQSQGHWRPGAMVKYLRTGALFALYAYTDLTVQQVCALYPEDLRTWQLPLEAWRMLARWERVRMEKGCYIVHAPYLCTIRGHRFKALHHITAWIDVRWLLDILNMEVTLSRARRNEHRKSCRWIYRPASCVVFRGYGERYGTIA